MIPIYLDYAATTPVDSRVAARMALCLTADGVFGNPASSTHAFGREAAAMVDSARDEVAALVGAETEDIVFTSGATEANNLAIFGVAHGCLERGRHIVTTQIEHKAVLDPVRRLEREGAAVTLLAPDRLGRIDPQRLREALRSDTVLVSVIHANNEIGVVQDLAEMATICREHGVWLHADAAQSVGKIPIDVGALGVDLLSFTAHKLYGPKGIGALYVAPSVRGWLQPQMLGGGHERGLRSGTPATHQIVGFGAAAALARAAVAAEGRRIAMLRDELWEQLAALPGLRRNGHAVHCVPGILSVSVEGVEGESLVTGLSELALATGSACSSASPEPSYVLRALGLEPTLAESTLRISLGRWTLNDDIERIAAAVRREVTRLRTMAP